ncbi:Protocadherin Fat 1 [Araneus ventricosus]|uniref:Protocadherin Fat 1 n=1 Tax=Araneus ventricosus TaxID=182803 RepID=A0A4Y2SDV0_ARAVE|nr:Protocadherin Fat 1 [Araneus ventricosus]
MAVLDPHTPHQLVRDIQSLLIQNRIILFRWIKAHVGYLDCECGPDSNCTHSAWFQPRKCICKPGYWEDGGKCVGPCTSNPCKNNGICEVEGKGFKCNCSKPWIGKTCETGPCDEQPCQNGGTCKVGETGFICNCLAPFSGTRCENGPCTSNPCQNNGTCEVSEDSYRCNCNKPFKGINCEIGKFNGV